MLTKKYSEYKVVALLTDSSSPDIDISHAASGEIAIPSAETYVTLTYYVKMGGNYYAAQDATPAAITQTVAADKSYPLPSSLFGASVIQIRANAAGNIRINLKS